MIKFQTFQPDQSFPAKVLFPKQVQGENIIQIISGQEDLSKTDGLFTNDKKFLLGVKTADCAPIVFISDNKFGIIHVGWRGLCQEICEKMLKIFSDEPCRIICGPFLPQFEIQPNFCYKAIKKKFGDKFFTESDNKIFFNFQAAILAILEIVEFDGRSTYDDKRLASWRRDRIENRRNITVVGEF